MKKDIDFSKIEEAAPVPKEMVEGAEAYSKKFKRETNPYLPDTESYENWDYGWQEGESYEEYMNSDG